MDGGTTFDGATPQAVRDILEDCRRARVSGRGLGSGYRLKLWYGDGQTGRAWGDVEVGYIGRSLGPVKIPLVLPTARSRGGCGVLDHCIVQIALARGGRVLWQHPTFQGQELGPE